MKTVFAFLILFMFVLASFGQSNLPADQKNAGLSSGMNTENQLFSVSRVYPNPVKDMVTVEFHSEESGSLQASLISIAGTEVKKWDSNIISKGDQKLKLDLSFLKTGVYFLKISSSGRVITQVVKKN
jgi:hypothetical protein